jgi:cytochrome c peroxidase
MSLGVRDRAETAVRSGIKYIQFAQRPDADAAAIDAYLKSLKPVPSPYLQAGKLSPAAERGRALFTQAGCIQCHSGVNFTDGRLHNLGLGTGMDAGKSFDTPTLIELWRTGPYLHDGRAATIQEVFTKNNPNDLHGKTSTLGAGQLDDLAQYVLSQ